MQAIRTPAFLRTLANAVGALLLVPLLAACPKGDVGAPCNHGDVDPPDAKVVTFPALSCNDLICIYGDDKTPPMTPCQSNEQCNADSEDGKIRFECVDNACRLASNFVLERSMCSKTCATDSDCEDGGIGKKVLAKESNCAGGFTCAQIQKLGEFCCEKLCVCRDDLSQGTIDMLATQCMAPDACEEDMMTPPPPATTGMP